MTRKQLAELNKLISRYIHHSLTPKEMERYRELVRKRDGEALAKLRKREENSAARR
jgi:hypothetical protein